MCFLRLSLVLATLPQSEQETWVLAICFASMCLLTSHFFPDMPHSIHWRDPPMPITRYWSIALSSSVSNPRNTFYKTINKDTCTMFAQSIYFILHISIFSGFCARWTCECQKGPCCQNWVHTGGTWAPQGGQSVPRCGSWQCPSFPWFFGTACTSKFHHWLQVHCQGRVPQ